MGERLQDDRPFLLGDRLTAADLSFAALAAPVLLPAEYGVPMPALDETPAALQEVIRELRGTPAGAFALRLYRAHRRQPQAATVN